MVSISAVQYSSLKNFNFFLTLLKLFWVFTETRVFWFYICNGTLSIFLSTECILKNNLPQKMQWTFQSAFLFHLVFIPVYILTSKVYFFLLIVLLTDKKFWIRISYNRLCIQTTEHDRGNVLFKLLCSLCILYLPASLTVSTIFYAFRLF